MTNEQKKLFEKYTEKAVDKIANFSLDVDVDVKLCYNK